MLRGRIFFADGRMAFGPEAAIMYKSMTYANDFSSSYDDTEISGFGTSYALRLDFLFE